MTALNHGRAFSLFAAAALLLGLVSCGASSPSGNAAETQSVRETSAPLQAAETGSTESGGTETGAGSTVSLTAETRNDCTEDFQEAEEVAVEEGTETLLAEYLPVGEAALSDTSFTVAESGEVDISLTATWAHSGEILCFGIVNDEGTEIWTADLTGGSAVGTLSLKDIPAGSYHVLTYAENGPEVLACVSYTVAD